MSNIARQMIDALLPEGPVWEPKTDGDMDKLFDAIADNWQSVFDFLSQLAYVRDPYLTFLLRDLEKEYGITTKTNISETDRRDQLAAIMYEEISTGSDDNLELILQRAGFGVQVENNSPPVNPTGFLNELFLMVAGGANAYCGNSLAYCSRAGGDLIVNGLSAFYSTLSANPQTWPFIFFIGKSFTRDPETDEIIDITPANIPIVRRDEFVSLILKYKPLHTWCGAIVLYT